MRWLLPLVLLPQMAYGMNFKITTRSDHKSLDIIARRLATWDAKEARACLLHVEPMLERHGGPIGWGAVEIGSEEEWELICAQHGYANTQVIADERKQDIKIGFFRFIRNSIVAVCTGLGPGVTIAIIVFVVYRYRLLDRTKALVAQSKVLDEVIPDKTERARKLSDPVIHKVHQDLKKKKLL